MTLKEGTRVALPMRRGVVEIVDTSGTGSFGLKIDGSEGELVWIDMHENWMEEALEPAEPKTLRERIAQAINATSSENGSNTPDFILAEYLVDCLAAFDKAVTKRAEWYGRMDHPCADRATVNLSEPPRLAKEGDRVWHPQARRFAQVIAVDLRIDEDKALVRYDQVEVTRSELEVVLE